MKKLIKQALVRREDRRYDRLLAAKKTTYGEWLAEKEKQWRKEGEGCDAAQEEEFLLVCQKGGVCAPYARQNIAAFFQKNPEVQVLYGDEDLLTSQGEYASPWFKPDWSPDLLDSCFYFGSLVAVRKKHWEEMAALYEKEDPEGGKALAKFSPESVSEAAEPGEMVRVSNPNQEVLEKWVHFCVRGGYEKGSRLVGHLPQILFHAPDEEAREGFLRESVYLKARRENLMSDFRKKVLSGQADSPLVSIVIPSKDQPEILAQCLEGVRNAAEGVPCEILLVDNGSSPENREKIEHLTEDHAARAAGANLPIRYLYQPMEFNFSRMCNLGAEEARGRLLLFLNDDVKMERGIGEMAARALRGYTGAVGLKLLYPQDELIQHAGVVNLPVGPVHKLQHHKDDQSYYFGRNRLNCNCVAVTGACLMLEADKFRKAGGFRESLKVAYNDVELCFRLEEAGYKNMLINDFSAEHHESLSRGSDESPEKRRRLREEWEQLYRLHPGFRGRDPYYPEGLNREGLDERVTPEYIYHRNTVQENAWRPFRPKLEQIRRDDCLMARVETCGPERMQGYSVVLGDDNACYDKYLLFIPQTSDAGKTCFCMKLEGQYRKDLEENLPDQKNVALGGFCVGRAGEELPPGTYRIAVLAKNRMNGMKLWNESGKSIEICRGAAGDRKRQE